MKALLSCLILTLTLTSIGCNRQDNVVKASRTESASSVSGWKEISTSGIALSFPPDWKPFDLANGAFDKAADTAMGSDPKYAAVQQQVKTLAKQGIYKLFVIDSTTVNSGFATNCNVIIQDIPANMTIEQVADQNVQQMKGVVATGTEPKLEYVNLKPGKTAVIKSQMKLPNPSIPPLASVLYISLKGSKMAVVTFAAPQSNEAGILKIAEQAMDTFRFTQ